MAHRVGFRSSWVRCKSANSVGARTQPCLSPPLISNASETLPCWIKLAVIPSCRARIRLIKRSGQPNLARVSHMAGLGTLSKAFLRSQKICTSSCCCSRHFSCSCLAQKSMSIVPRDGLTPHWDSGRISSANWRSLSSRIRAKILPAMPRSDIPR